MSNTEPASVADVDKILEAVKDIGPGLHALAASNVSLAEAFQSDTEENRRAVRRRLGTIIGILLGGFAIVFIWLGWRAQVTSEQVSSAAARQEEVRGAVLEVYTQIIAQNADDPNRITKPEVIALVCRLEGALSGQITLCDAEGNLVP